MIVDFPHVNLLIVLSYCYESLLIARRAIVRIISLQNFEPVPVPVKEYGKFYTGDSYIVLNVRVFKLLDLNLVFEK